jgi:hypothetical protein
MTGGAWAHDIPSWGYDNMFRMSEFVVIAQATANTRDTTERTALRDCTPPLRVIGVATGFESLYVLKGPKVKHFTVHHYREVPVHLKSHEVYFQDCADFISFKAHVATQPFLMFLVRERNGRFAPVGGQLDPKMSLQKIYEP